MKVSLSGRVKPKNRKRVEERAKEIDRTVSDTLDRILDDYFSLEKNREVA